MSLVNYKHFFFFNIEIFIYIIINQKKKKKLHIMATPIRYSMLRIK